jgi:hypothetical protein
VRDVRLEWESDDSGYTCAVRCKLLPNRMIKVFTPSFADQSNTNAQNLEVKEGVARMDPSRFRAEASLANGMKQDWRSFRNSYEWRA